MASAPGSAKLVAVRSTRRAKMRYHAASQHQEDVAAGEAAVAVAAPELPGAARASSECYPPERSRARRRRVRPHPALQAVDHTAGRTAPRFDYECHTARRATHCSGSESELALWYFGEWASLTWRRAASTPDALL